MRACVEEDRFGAAAHVLSAYLEHDVCLAVSEYTRDLIVTEAAAIDARHGTRFAAQLPGAGADLVPGGRRRLVPRA